MVLGDQGLTLVSRLADKPYNIRNTDTSEALVAALKMLRQPSRVVLVARSPEKKEALWRAFLDAHEEGLAEEHIVQLSLHREGREDACVTASSSTHKSKKEGASKAGDLRRPKTTTGSYASDL
jgi:GTP-dependent phosphoenolpyruvate carboxykinase